MGLGRPSIRTPINVNKREVSRGKRDIGGSSPVSTHSRHKPLAIGLPVVAGKAQQLCSLTSKCFKQVRLLFEYVVDIQAALRTPQYSFSDCTLIYWGGAVGESGCVGAEMTGLNRSASETKSSWAASGLTR